VTEPSGAWSLAGPFTFREVPGWYRESLSWYQSTGLPEELDLARLDRTDSSALALLLEWQSWARHEGRRVRFLNPPEGLRVYAQLTDTDELLGWSDEKAP